MRIFNSYFTWRWFLFRLLLATMLMPVFFIASAVLGIREYNRDPKYDRDGVFWYIVKANKVLMMTTLLFVLGGIKGIPKDYQLLIL